ncbi:MAG: GNAT family N-acetyltransferase [Flavobacterium sp. BFFFF2]|nr:MAG: GNAT family N-acetyltransferase [Flavobacterium sp. BFFFF2]
MDILHQDDSKKGMFYVVKDDKTLAEMTYVWAGTNQIIIDHTAVDSSLSGKGVGKQLVVKAVDFARSKGIKIIPLCPFAKSVFQKITEFNDVL